MTAPDRGATHQIPLASTGSSTHDAWYPRWGSARGGGRVKRRSPPIIGQFTVAVGVEAVRRLRIHYPESNKIAHFHQGNEFSHGLGHEERFPLPRPSGRCRFQKRSADVDVWANVGFWIWLLSRDAKVAHNRLSFCGPRRNIYRRGRQAQAG